MLDPVALFEFDPHVDRRTVRAKTLVVTLGTQDPGNTQQIIDRHLLDTMPNHRLGGVDVDQVVNYAELRPHISFDRDHFVDYQPPAIDLHAVTDAQGTGFLLLSGPEPAMQWERMAATVDYLIDQFGITDTVVVHGVPAPSPHTRPMYVSTFAGEAGIVPVEDGLPVRFEMGATFTGLLTLRLGEWGRSVTGLVAHVPHYLAAGDVPESAIALLERLAAHSELDLPTGRLEIAAHAFRAQVDVEVADSEEAAQMVGQLEQQYDHFRSQRALLADVEVPTADEIGSAVEDFLRGLDDPEGANQPEDANEPEGVDERDDDQ